LLKQGLKLYRIWSRQAMYQVSRHLVHLQAQLLWTLEPIIFVHSPCLVAIFSISQSAEHAIEKGHNCDIILPIFIRFYNCLYFWKALVVFLESSRSVVFRYANNSILKFY
jgi:hypothetical protein